MSVTVLRDGWCFNNGIDVPPYCLVFPDSSRFVVRGNLSCVQTAFVQLVLPEEDEEVTADD